MALAIRGSAPKQSPLQGPTNVRSYRPGLSTKTCRPCIFTVCPTGKQHLPRQSIRFWRRRLLGLHDCSRLLNFSNTLPKGQATFFFFSFSLPFSTIQTCCLFWQSSFVSDAPKASLEDVIYALNCFLTTVTTKKPETPSSSPMRLSFADDFLDLPRSLTFAVPHEGKTAYEEIPQSLYCAAYLGKIQTLMSL